MSEFALSSSKRKKKGLTESERNFIESAMVDSTRLRTALMIACLELTGGDPLEAMDLAEHFYDEAPKLLSLLTEQGVSNLPAGPAQILDFPIKGS